MNITREEATKRALEFLCRKFPACFVKRPDQRRPLALDIHDDIDARFEASRDRDFVHRAIKAYRNNYRYQRARSGSGLRRIDLDGRQAAASPSKRRSGLGRHDRRLDDGAATRQPDDPETAEAQEAEAPGGNRAARAREPQAREGNEANEAEGAGGEESRTSACFDGVKNNEAPRLLNSRSGASREKSRRPSPVPRGKRPRRYIKMKSV